MKASDWIESACAETRVNEGKRKDRSVFSSRFESDSIQSM